MTNRPPPPARRRCSKKPANCREKSETPHWQRWELYFTARCERLEILYSDTNLDIEATFKAPTGKQPNDPTTSDDLNKADGEPAASGKPQAICRRKT